jgi:hypothetical protein
LYVHQQLAGEITHNYGDAPGLGIKMLEFYKSLSKEQLQHLKMMNVIKKIEPEDKKGN